ncbi:MAG: hypothetical protein CMH70_02650 [Nitrosomonadaceae bacterium]|nr:hypothetical protein [Nitrosomonadaceae bacterium]|tara:strand:- start:1261 stop:1647 length:387 start_codon:yes stop_codon:yes gene_type:complete
MKRLLLFLILITLNNSVKAEWVYINKTIDTFYYINPDIIKKSNNNVKMWILGDFITGRKLKNGIMNLSIIDHTEFNCTENKSRSTYQVLYTDNMGKGEKIHTFSDPGEWTSIVPQSAGETHFKFVCRK